MRRLMKGVILAGGRGERLTPLTKVTNKHLLPVYNKPMIYYPLATMLRAGIRDILIVSGPGHAGDFVNLLGSGREFGARLSYEVQDEAGGIAQALGLSEDFAGGGPIMVVLGDNIFEDDLGAHLKEYSSGAMLFLKETDHPERFGVAEFEGGKVVGISEKPKKPKSNYAVTGAYVYDSEVFRIIRKLKPSKRGELEITDVNNTYIRQGMIKTVILGGFWSDAGTFESMHDASTFVRRWRRQHEP